jgi:N-acetylglucosamine kinase-like BadF-type ATPase
MPNPRLHRKNRLIGVDLGGTWLRACAIDGRGRILRRVKMPASPPERLNFALRKLWKQWGLGKPDQLIVGSKGVWKSSKTRGMAVRLRGLAERITVISDVEMAYAATLGDRPGILLLAGTGSIALALDAKGRWRRAGGLGPDKGDEGSAYWIGRKYLKRTSRRVLDIRRTAALARRVLRLAPRSVLCAGIIDEAQGHLSSLVEKLAVGKTLRIGWWGGLMSDDRFRRGVFNKVRKALPLSVIEVKAPPKDPLGSAIRTLGKF